MAAPPPVSRRDRLRGAARRTVPVLKSRSFWLGLLAIVGALVLAFVLVNSVLMPIYTRQGAAVTVPEVRDLSYEDAVRIAEDRRLRPERRDQPFNPSVPRDRVLDQNPAPSAEVKPGRRLYLYVNSGPERTVQMPEIRTLSESLARAELNELGLVQVDVERDDRPSPYPGTVARQRPEPGETIGTGDRVTLWISPGLSGEEVEIPDVRGLAPDAAAAALQRAGLWVDPTRTVSGTITRQEPEAGSTVRQGTEVTLSSIPIEEQDEPELFEDDLSDEEPDAVPEPPSDSDDDRDASRRDW